MHPVLRPASSRRPASDTKNILNCDNITRVTRDPAFDAGDPQGAPHCRGCVGVAGLAKRPMHRQRLLPRKLKGKGDSLELAGDRH